jgi:hypothetical protein
LTATPSCDPLKNSKPATVPSGGDRIQGLVA